MLVKSKGVEKRGKKSARNGIIFRKCEILGQNSVTRKMQTKILVDSRRKNVLIGSPAWPKKSFPFSLVPSNLLLILPLFFC